MLLRRLNRTHDVGGSRLPGKPVALGRSLTLFGCQILSLCSEFLSAQSESDTIGVAQADRLACSNKLLGLRDALAPARIVTLEIGKDSSGFGP